MSSPSQTHAGLDAALVDRLAGLTVPAALDELARTHLATVAAALQLAQTALAAAEAAPANARHWLAIGATLNQELGDGAAVRGWLAYAQARLYLQERNLGLAETALRAAQAAWQESGDASALARSYLGLTQILAMQGRYAAAEAANRAAIAYLQTASDEEARSQLASAYNNLANLLVYQEQHRAALAEFARARQLLEALIAAPTQAEEQKNALWDKLADVRLNEANALMSLDAIYEAEAALQSAIDHYDRIGDPLSRGRARTNLGSLYLRTGRYTASLSQFDAAARDLLGPDAGKADANPYPLQNADILLLDQANAYLALNLLPEATATLERCEALLRAAGQPYELGQALLTLGLLRLRNADESGAATALQEAERLFTGLQNQFWLNRTGIALALLEIQRNQTQRAAARLDRLLAHPPPGRETGSEAQEAVRWDISSYVEAQLLRLRLHLEEDEIAAARQCAAAVAAAIGAAPEEVESTDPAQFWLPHLYLRWRQALGAAERAAGNRALALSHWRVAITLLETQRSTLPIEELRTAFLEDKTALYSDLVTGLLEESGPDAVAAAFAVVERARARTLLERLLTTGAPPGEEPDATLAARRAELQQRLHWLYNQMLGEAGNRRADTGRNEEVRECEAALQRLEWQTAPPLAEAHPVDLAALQQTLAADQQALVYYVAGAEVLAFVVGHQSTQLFRHLCTVDRLEEALATWRFQLERAEMGEQLYGRHAERYQRAWQTALLRLYQLVIAPLAPALQTLRLLVIPFGSLHQLPFHALWDGESVLLERFEWTYAPSASIAVHTLLQRQPEQRWRSLAGLALTDAAIPAAQEEVKAAAGVFAHAHLYLDDQASLAGLQNAATVADVLHIATHGRFRPDNPFFSMLKLADGWVDVRSLYRLPLAARLVVLSACESGAGRVRGGDEVIGVARGFLAAGARSVIASLWNVHDASTAALMARFYALLTGGGTPQRPAAALRAAQLHAASERRHPFYWASFLAIG